MSELRTCPKCGRVAYANCLACLSVESDAASRMRAERDLAARAGYLAGRQVDVSGPTETSDASKRDAVARATAQAVADLTCVSSGHAVQSDAALGVTCTRCRKTLVSGPEFRSLGLVAERSVRGTREAHEETQRSLARLGDERQAIKDENKDLLAENAKLRRALERVKR